MKVIASILRQAFLRFRRGPRRGLPAYVLLVPEADAQILGAPLQAAIDLHAQGWSQGAAANLQVLARRAAGCAAAHALHGQVLLEMGKSRAAAQALARARQLAPKLAADAVLASERAKSRGQLREALGGMLLAALLEPASWVIKSRVADVYYAMGALEEAVSWVEAAFQQSGRDSLRVKRLILLFAPIYRSVEHLAEVRRRYLQGLQELEHSALRIDNILAEVNLTNFYLAYQGMNERDSQARLVALLLRAAPELGFVAAHCRQLLPRRARIKVGIVSAYFGFRHSVSIAYTGLIEGLAKRADMEVTAVCVSEQAAATMTQTLGARARTRALVKNDLRAARQQLAELELDVLLYADVGMEPFTYYLAFGRYARLQGVLGGHPLTTGIPNIDIYISSERLECPEAQDHYTERLVRLNRLPLGMQAPDVPPVRPRETLGLPLSGHLYVCPLKLQKFHPEFDGALRGILEADPEAEMVLFDDHQYHGWNTLARQRLERTLAGHAERVTFLPWQTENFLPILVACDVALDTFHFGAGTTAALALGVGCPMVTLPSPYQRARSTLACYLTIGIHDCIARDRDHYVQIALRIAGDPAYRASLRDRLLARRHALFEAGDAARELGDVLLALHGERRG